MELIKNSNSLCESALSPKIIRRIFETKNVFIGDFKYYLMHNDISNSIVYIRGWVVWLLFVVEVNNGISGC